MNSEIIDAYRKHLKKLEALPFEMGLPEEIQRVKAHIKSLEPDPKGEWDRGLRCYIPWPKKQEHIDI